MSHLQLADLRKDYTLKGLDISDVSSNPMEQFERWFREVIAAGLPEPNAMHLSTVSPEGRPAGRIVLLKAVDERGFVFFTNYQSRKGLEMGVNPWVALTFFWEGLERQVRIEGQVEKVNEVESDTYFQSRPRGSQLGAWISSQSQPVAARSFLEEQYAQVSRRYEGQTVPRPPHWGGFRVLPSYLEFWQGRPSRLHDRLAYTLTEGQWLINRLAP